MHDTITFQTAVSVIGSVLGFAISIFGFIRGRAWFAAFHAKIDIIQANTKRVVALEEQVQALTITAYNWRETAAAVQAKVDRLEVIVPKFNAAIRYIQALIDYAMKVERAAKRAGASMRGVRMPEIPPELKDEIEWLA